MNIDERLEKLAERHEALAQSVEMLVMQGRETDKRIDKLGSSIDDVSKGVNGLTTIVMQLVTSTASLLRTAEAQERRITRLEDAS